MIDTTQIKSDVMHLCEDVANWNERSYTSTEMNRNCYECNTLAEFTELMTHKYEYLHTNSKTLFDNCINGTVNHEQLTYMLTMLDKVNSGADYNKTSEEVGQKLVDIYVKPLIEKK